LFKNLSVNSLKRVLSNDTTFNPPLFSLSIPLRTGLKKVLTQIIHVKTAGQTAAAAESAHIPHHLFQVAATTALKAEQYY
jgi:hypothetical protein